MFALLVLVYVFGKFSNLWAYGRVISFIVLILHIALAVGIAQIESRSFIRRISLPLQKALFSFLILGLIVPYSYKNLIKPVLQRAAPGIQSTYSQSNGYQTILDNMMSC